MAKPLSLTYVKKIAQERGGKCLSQEYKNNYTHMKWKCKCGYIWNASFANIKNNKSWCPKCGYISKRKLTYEFVKKKIEEIGGTLLSNTYINNSTPLKIKCVKGHIWYVAYTNISQGRQCPKCSGFVRYSFVDVKNFIEKCDGILLSKTFNTVKDKIHIKCNKCLYEWKTTFDGIKNNKHWCPNCAKLRTIKKLSCNSDEVINMINNKGGKLLSNYVKNHDKIKVQCLKCNYIWYPTRANISQGKWCPNCSVCVKYTIENVKKEIQNKNGILLSNNYKNVKSKIKVKCGMCSNIWFPTFSRVLQGHWCPRCNLSKRKKQNELYDIIKEIYSCNVLSGYTGFDWLRSEDTNRKQEIDIFVFGDNFSLAIEYDGEQHFKSIDFFGGDEGLKRRQYLDKNKDKLIKQHNKILKYFIRFNYKDKICKKNIIEKLIKNNIPII